MAKEPKDLVTKEERAKDVEPDISLLEFIQTFSGPIELRGGFMYEMQVKGKTHAKRTAFIEEFKKFRKRPVV